MSQSRGVLPGALPSTRFTLSSHPHRHRTDASRTPKGPKVLKRTKRAERRKHTARPDERGRTDDTESRQQEVPTPSFAEAWFIKSPCCPAACEARRARPKSPSTMRVGTAPSGADPEAAEAILGLRESARGSVWSRESQSYYRLRHRRSHDSRATDLPPMGRPLVPPPGTTRTPPTARRAVLSSHTHITPE